MEELKRSDSDRRIAIITLKKELTEIQAAIKGIKGQSTMTLRRFKDDAMSMVERDSVRHRAGELRVNAVS